MVACGSAQVTEAESVADLKLLDSAMVEEVPRRGAESSMEASGAPPFALLLLSNFVCYFLQHQSAISYRQSNSETNSKFETFAILQCQESSLAYRSYAPRG